MKLFVIIGMLICTITIGAFAQHKTKFSLNEIQASDTPHTCNRLLIIAAGAALDRIFADNLYEAIQSHLHKHAVTSTYQFIPVNYGDTSIQFNQKNAAASDAILFLFPDSLSMLSIKVKSNWTNNIFPDAGHLYSNPSTKSYSRKMNYQQAFTIRIAESKPAPKSPPIWLGSLQTNFDPMDKEIYMSIAKELVKQLATKGIIK